LDVAVDLRNSSPTYGQHFKIFLSAENKKQLFIPEGFAHGFLALEDHTIFSYKCSNYYHPHAEEILLWNDLNLAIDWEIKEPIISKRDLNGNKFDTFRSPF
jgi:dTDP-4-dehydrorhamnose 3,5-epimerase